MPKTMTEWAIALVLTFLLAFAAICCGACGAFFFKVIKWGFS